MEGQGKGWVTRRRVRGLSPGTLFRFPHKGRQLLVAVERAGIEPVDLGEQGGSFSGIVLLYEHRRIITRPDRRILPRLAAPALGGYLFDNLVIGKLHLVDQRGNGFQHTRIARNVYQFHFYCLF